MAPLRNNLVVFRAPSGLVGNALIGRAERDFQGADKSQPASAKSPACDALHSPNALLETGLRICPAEKIRDSDHLRCQAVRSLQSGLSWNNREIRAFCAFFGGRGADFLSGPDCVAEREGIRTLGTGLSGVRADVCVSCAESTSSEILRETTCSPFETLNSAVSRSLQRRNAGDCVAESGRYEASHAAKLVRT
jgi:hypothetical protein